MADIFVSYAHEDRSTVSALAKHLASCGWTVWWDRQIRAGKDFDNVIQNEVDATRCLLVVWSAHSVKSRWVRAEASEGLRREILVPILLDNSPLPLAFRNVQTIEFGGSGFDAGSAAALDLVDALTGLLGTPSKPAPSPAPVPSIKASPVVVQSPIGEPTSPVSEPVGPPAVVPQAAPIAIEPAEPGSSAPDRAAGSATKVPSIDMRVDEPRPSSLPTSNQPVWLRFRWATIAVVLIVLAAVTYPIFNRNKSTGGPSSADAGRANPGSPPAPSTRTEGSGTPPAASDRPEAKGTPSPTTDVAKAAAPSTAPPPVEIANNQRGLNDSAIEGFVASFLAAVSDTDLDRTVSFYADRVNYFGKGVVGLDYVRSDKRSYFARWPIAKLTLNGPVTVTATDLPNRRLVKFRAIYEVESPERRQRANGTSENTLVVSLEDGALKIVDQKEVVKSAKD